jgi:hypothetical protein
MGCIPAHFVECVPASPGPPVGRQRDSSSRPTGAPTEGVYKSRSDRAARSGNTRFFRGAGPAISSRKRSHSESRIPVMKHLGFAVIVFLGVASTCVFAQLSAKGVVDPIPVVTVCDIVNNPLRFKDKLIRVRGQILTNVGTGEQFWINQPSFSKVCRFLPAKFQGPTNLAASSAFGTFTGRVVVDTTFSGSSFLAGRGTQSKVFFLIEQLSNLYGQQDYRNGLVPIVRLFDPQSGTFLRPY